MSTAELTNPIFTDETAAREYLEAQRWPDAVSCPHCGSLDKITKMQGKSHRPGLYLCGSCRGNFSVTVGTLYERSKIPLTKWLLATHLLSSSEKGISVHQIHRLLGITYKSAWFMRHRIREAMKADGNEPTIGGTGEVIEADETYIGRKHGMKKGHAENVAKETALMTDQATHCGAVGKDFASHETVRHLPDEYVRGNAHTNTIESFFWTSAG